MKTTKHKGHNMKKAIAAIILIGNLTAQAAPSHSNKVYMDHEFKRLTQKQASKVIK